MCGSLVFLVDTDLAGARTDLLKGLAVVRPLLRSEEITLLLVEVGSREVCQPYRQRIDSWTLLKSEEKGLDDCW